MIGAGRIFIVFVSMVIVNGAPHFLNSFGNINNGLFGLPYLCGNQLYGNIGQSFMCNYYSGLLNSPRLLGYRSQPDGYSDDEDDDGFESREFISHLDLNMGNNNIFDGSEDGKEKIKTETKYDKDTSKDNLINNESSIQDTSEKGSKSGKDITIPVIESNKKNNKIIFPDEIGEFKNVEEENPISIKNKWNEDYLHKIYLIGNQPEEPKNNGVFLLPVGDINGDSVPNDNDLDNSINPAYVSNNAAPNEVNHNTNQNSNQQYFGLPLNGIPIILVPNDDGQTIISNTRQVIVVGNGQNIPTSPSQIFILNNGQNLIPSIDQVSGSLNGKSGLIKSLNLPNDENMLQSQDSSEGILEDEIKPNLPESIIPPIGQSLPKTNEQPASSAGQITPIENIPVGLLAGNENLPEENLKLPQDSQQILPQDDQNLTQDSPLTQNLGINLPQGNVLNVAQDSVDNLPQNNINEIFDSGNNENNSKEFPPFTFK